MARVGPQRHKKRSANGYNALLKACGLILIRNGRSVLRGGADCVVQKLILCVIPGFLRCLNEVFALLWCYAALSASYRRFGTACQSHLQRSNRHLDINELLLGTACLSRRYYCGILNACKARCLCLSGSNTVHFKNLKRLNDKLKEINLLAPELFFLNFNISCI